ncbi:MAG: sugar-transfer associated ATP-grasp domain-containing protein [Thiohalospira sp.]
MFNDKLIFNFFIKNFTHNISEVIGFVFDNKYFSLNSEFDISRAEYNLIGRLRNGWNAIGIKRFLSGTYNKTEIEKFNNYVFTLELKNDSYCSKIFSSSLNTIRIISAWNNDNFIKIIAAVHRFGIKDDIVADNFQSGGGTALVDIKSGVLGELIYFKGKKRIITHKHPLTNMQILGVKIPKWKNICENLIKIHMQMPYLKYIAWDIAIISGGDWVIIEGNHVSGLEAIQIHEPFKLPF